MPLARVVTFEGVDKNRIEELKREMQEGEPPAGFPAAEMLMLHDAENDESLVVLIFETEDDYRVGDEVLECNADWGHTRAANVGQEVRRRPAHDPDAHLTTVTSARKTR